MSKEQMIAILNVGAENPPPQGSIEELRAWFEGINKDMPIAPGATISPVSVGPCSAELIRLPDSRDDQLVIYYHGGGFVMGSPRSHNTIATFLAQASGATVLSVDYRLAPEHPAPTAHDDSFEAVQWALGQGYQPGAIALVGDSAGGNLALAVAIRMREAGMAPVGCLALMSPALDLAGDGVSHKEVADDPILRPELIELFNHLYLGDGDRRSSLATPFYKEMGGLPPVLLHVGSWEILRDDSISVAERIKAAGGSASLKIWDGMTHSWQLYAPILEEGMQSIQEAGDFIQTQFASRA